MTYVNTGDGIQAVDQLFVYGIFLDADHRLYFGMSNAQYDTVADWVTVGRHIVQAIPCKGATLTGLLVDVDIKRWPEIDRLERNYDRRKVTTESGVQAYMYTAKEE